jgi:hypothetical protein
VDKESTLKTISKALVLLGMLSGPIAASADPIAYATIDGGNFGTLDLSTGVFSLLGTSATTVAGLGVFNGSLYGGAYTGGTLYSINPSNGAETTIGSASITYDDFGSTPTGGLFALNGSGELYSVNAGNGSVKDVGNIGFGISGDSNLSNDSGTLYLVSNSNLYTVNTGTGAATLIGASGTGASGLVFDNGTLYGATNSVYTFNTTTGAATAVAGLSGSGAGLVFGLASDPITSAVPEPDTYLLGLAGVIVIGLTSRLRERNMSNAKLRVGSASR